MSIPRYWRYWRATITVRIRCYYWCFFFYLDSFPLSLCPCVLLQTLLYWWRYPFSHLSWYYFTRHCATSVSTILFNSSSIRFRQFLVCVFLVVPWAASSSKDISLIIELLQVFMSYTLSLRSWKMFFHLRIFLVILDRHSDLSFDTFSVYFASSSFLTRHDHLQVAPIRFFESDFIPIPFDDFSCDCFDAQILVILTCTRQFVKRISHSSFLLSDFFCKRLVLSYSVFSARSTSEKNPVCSTIHERTECVTSIFISNFSPITLRIVLIILRTDWI